MEDTVNYAEWLLSGDNEDIITLCDKIEQMASITDLPDTMHPMIEIGGYNGNCKLIYYHPAGAYDYIHMFAMTGPDRSNGGKILQCNLYLRDLKAKDLWAYDVRKKAKDMLDEVSSSKAPCHYRIRLSLSNEFYSYNNNDSAYFMGLPAVEE